MIVAVAGGTGFVGQVLVRALIDEGHQVIVISRSRGTIKRYFGSNVKMLKWADFETKEAGYMLKDIDALINLAGVGIADKRWNSEYKKAILDSRVETTQTLVNFLLKKTDKKIPFLNASAVGIYGNQKVVKDGLPQGLEEGAEKNFDRQTNFLSEVCDQWENIALKAKAAGHRVVCLRIGVVLGRHGGALKKMELPFHLYAGGPIGSGKQPLPWISRQDLCKAIIFALNKEKISGPVNLVSPLCVTNKEFAKTLGKVLNKPSFMPTPGFPLKIALGEMADLMILNGVHVVPKKLKDAGFMFDHPDLETALRYIYK